MSGGQFRYNGCNWFDQQACLKCGLRYEVMVVKGPDNTWRHPIPEMMECPLCKRSGPIKGDLNYFQRKLTNETR